MTFKTVGVKSNGYWLMKNYGASKAVYESLPAQELPSSSRCELAGGPKAFLCTALLRTFALDREGYSGHREMQPKKGSV